MKDMTINTILLCFTNNTFREVLDLTDPIDIWEKLESRYKSKLLTNRLYLKRRLFALQMEEADFNKHIYEFNEIITRLDYVDVTPGILSP